MKIKYDSSLLQYMTLVESLTGAKVRDVIAGETLTFIIENGQMGLAIGKGGKNLKMLEHKLKRSIKFIEFNEQPLEFIKNYVAPLHKFTINQQDRVVTITGEDVKTKGLLIGRERANLKRLLDVTKRYFPIDEIKVV